MCIGVCSVHEVMLIIALELQSQADHIEYLEDQQLKDHSSITECDDRVSFIVVSSPDLLRGEGLVHTACACTSVIQILNNPLTYGYCRIP